MKKTSFAKMQGGWFLGNFKPSAYKTNSGEVAIKKYVQGYVESSYCHENAATIYVILSGEIRFNGVVCKKDDVIHYGYGEVISIKALSNAIVMLVVIGASKFVRGKDLCFDELVSMYSSFFGCSGSVVQDRIKVHVK